MHPFKSNSNAWNPCSMVVKPRDGHGPWTILNTGSTSHRRQAAPFACAEPWDAIVLPLSPLTPPCFLDVVFPYRWYRRLSLWLLCCLFFPNWSYFDFWYSWMKMDERNRSFQWHNMAMENQTLEVVFEETPYPTCRMTIPSVFLVVFVCVCNVVETVIWNTLEHLKPGRFWTLALIYKKRWWFFKNHPLSS